MTRRRLARILLGVAVIGAAMTATPSAGATEVGPPDLPCESAFSPPFDYPCNTAEAAIGFVWDQAGNVYPFVEEVGDAADEIADNTYHTVSCTVNPDDPDCQ